MNSEKVIGSSVNLPVYEMVDESTCYFKSHDNDEKPLLLQSNESTAFVTHQNHASNIGNRVIFYESTGNFDSYEEVEITEHTLLNNDQSYWKLELMNEEILNESCTVSENYDSGDEQNQSSLEKVMNDDVVLASEYNVSNEHNYASNLGPAAVIHDGKHFKTSNKQHYDYNNEKSIKNKNFIELLRNTKELGQATVFKIPHNQHPSNIMEKELPKKSDKNTGSDVSRDVVSIRKGILERQILVPSNDALNMVYRPTTRRTNPKMYALMEDLSLVLPVKLHL